MSETLNWSDVGVSELVPTGTVTFLLADVEGSTRLWETQPEVMASAVAQLQRVANECITSHGGVRPIEQGEGDSFVAAFARASDAVACALDLQRAPLEPIRIRIGVHTGEAQLRDEANYVGPAVNRTARLRDLGHGGQTLLSGATEPIVIDYLPDDAWLNDLGTHRLRDLPRPERVVQLCHPDVNNEFPPLRTSESVEGRNLPTRLTSFIGRRREMEQVCALISDNRLTTLTGAGGAGKTRLATEVTTRVAQDFPDGAWFVDLASVTDPLAVPTTTARSLGLPDQPGRSTTEILRAFLGNRRGLLLLDNCEHLLDACGEMVTELVHDCPQLTILTTSREPLGVPGELTWRIPSLSLPDEAVELFADRAQRARAEFTLTEDNAALAGEICGRLDGMPLAIELAAARVRSLTLAQINDSLHDRFRLLTGGSRTAVRRQQTLRASVDWSHALLTEPERVLFRRLAVFMGGFDLDAAQSVGCDTDVEHYQLLDQLSLLVDKSLVVADDHHSSMRYRLLETVRQYALEKLGESGEGDAVRTRHRDHYASCTTQFEMTKPQGFAEFVDWAELEIDNLREAFNWSLETSEVESALELASALQPLWASRGRLLEGLGWLDSGLGAEVHDPVAPPVRAWALANRAILAALLVAVEHMVGSDVALAIAREVGEPGLLVRALFACGCVTVHFDIDTAKRHLVEANDLARGLGDLRSLGQCLSGIAFIESMRGNPSTSCPAAREALSIPGAVSDRSTLLQTRVYLGLGLMMRGELNEAAAELTAVVADCDIAQDKYTTSLAEVCRAWVLAVQGDAGRARTAAEIGLDAATALGGSYQDVPYAALAVVALAEGDASVARANSQASRDTTQRPDFARRISSMAESALLCGDLESARHWADESRPISGWWLMRALTTRARITMTQGQCEEAERDLHKGLDIASEVGAYLGVADIFECLAALAHLAESDREAARLLGVANGVRERMGHVRFKVYDTWYRDLIAEVRKVFEDNDFDVVWAEGAALSLEEAIAYARRGRGERKRPSNGWASLTPTELDVVRLVSRGLPNKEIATQLFVSPRTVQTHLTHVYTKLGLTSRVQLAQEATRHT